MFLPLLLTASALALHLQPETGAPPYRQPQLAAGYGQVALAFGADRSIYFAASPDQGKTFSTPVKVTGGQVLALGRHRGPRVTILRDAILVSAVVGAQESHEAHAHGLPSDGDLVVWRSVDHGKSWSPAGIVNDVPGAAREGLHAIAADAHGRLTAAWLDLRGKGTALYASRSTDGGLHWSKNELVYASPDGTICQCCDPSIALDEKGEAAVMFRNVLDGSRDFYVAHSASATSFSSPQKQGVGTWKLNACPMDGGGLVYHDGHLFSAWRREHDVFLAEEGQPEKRLGAGTDVALASTKAGLYVGWTNAGKIELLRPGAQAATILGEGSFLSLTAMPDGSVLAAWEAGGAIHAEPVTH